MLSLLIFLPLIMSVGILFIKKDQAVRVYSLINSLVLFVVSLLLLLLFKKESAELQLVERYDWIRDYGISYFVGVDGLSLWLILLTTLLTPIIIGASWSSITKKVQGYHIALFVLQSSVIGSFVAMDTILFYLFFELSLIPMYFMVGIWGGENRIYATYKFFIYTMAGSVFMLAGIIYLIVQTKLQLGFYSASVLDFYKLSIPYLSGQISPQAVLFAVFALAFAIKVPVFPVHTWLPDAHVQAPTGGSVVLAGVMLKMGTYGFVRFVIPLFPIASTQLACIFLILGVIGIIYGALVAMVQTDVKKLVAYSSVSHMGYVMLGLFAFNIYGLTGGVFQMLAHGISTGGLFLMVGMIYERTHSREIAKYGGLAKVLPIFTILFMIVTFSSIAVPLTNGFVGEFLILLGAFKSSKIIGALAVTGVILGAAYMLWMVKRVFFGEAGEIVKSHSDMEDLNLREKLVMAPIIVLIFWMGIFPNHFLSWSAASIEHLTNNQGSYRLQVMGQDPVMETLPPKDMTVPESEEDLNDGGLQEDV